jgi:hypothetical protein
MHRGCGKIFKKLRGLNAKWYGIMNFSDLFSNRKSGGLSPQRVDRAAQLRSIVGRGSADRRVWRRLASAQRAGARAHWCSLAAVEEDEPDEAMPEGCSPEHERQRRGDTTDAKNGGGLSSARG